MNRLKRFISNFMALCICTSSLAALPVKAEDIVYDSLQNCGFEEPSIGTTSYKQVQGTTVPNWNTTAYGGLVEILRQNNGVYIPNYTLTPREGSQAAELNADEQSSLYQSIKTVPGSFVKWGISHHGRNGYDTMLLVIGPKQSVDPSKKSKVGYDQFMKIGNYIKNNSELSQLIPTGNGVSKEFVIYSPKFAEKGGFVTGENPVFTTYRTVSNTEKWHIWFIRSNNDKWYDYGTNANTDELGYSNLYEVPEDQTETTFAFTAYESAVKSNGTMDLTYGNIIDSINFGLLYNVTLHTLAGGSASITAANDKSLNVSYKDINFATEKYKSGTAVTLTVTPDNDADYVFAGATINGTVYNHDDFATNSTNTEYTKDITVDEAKYAKLVFARKGHIIYDPNGGSYRGTTDVTDKEFAYYTNGKSESEVPVNSSAAFTDWTLYTDNTTNTGITIPANHTVTYSAADTSKPTLIINWKDENGASKSVTLPATKESGVVLVANYSFKHETLTLTDGGSVDIKNSTQETTVTGDESHRTTAGAEGDVITVIANTVDGYQFDGWYESATGEPISKALEYSYVVTGNTKIYAKFSKKVEEEIKEDATPTPVPTEQPTPVPTAAPSEKPGSADVPEYTVPSFDNSYAYIYGYSDSVMAPENNVIRGEVAAMMTTE